MLIDTYLVTDDPWHIVFPLLKFLFYLVLLSLFYLLFIRRRKAQTGSFKDEQRKIYVRLRRNRKNNPMVLTLQVENSGNRGVVIEAPVVAFSSWTKTRKFRILSVEFSPIFPVYIDIDKTQVLSFSLEQFYNFAPELRKTRRIRVEVSEVNGPTFKSGTVRL